MRGPLNRRPVKIPTKSVGQPLAPAHPVGILRHLPMAHHTWTRCFIPLSTFSTHLNHPGSRVLKLTLQMVHLRLAITNRRTCANAALGAGKARATSAQSEASRARHPPCILRLRAPCLFSAGSGKHRRHVPGRFGEAPGPASAYCMALYYIGISYYDILSYYIILYYIILYYIMLYYVILRYISLLLLLLLLLLLYTIQTHVCYSIYPGPAAADAALRQRPGQGPTPLI